MISNKRQSKLQSDITILQWDQKASEQNSRKHNLRTGNNQTSAFNYVFVSNSFLSCTVTATSCKTWSCKTWRYTMVLHLNLNALHLWSVNRLDESVCHSHCGFAAVKSAQLYTLCNVLNIFNTFAIISWDITNWTNWTMKTLLMYTLQFGFGKLFFSIQREWH